MSRFAFLLICVQACLIQNVFSVCYGASPGYGWGTEFGPYASGVAGCGFAGPLAGALAGPYAAGFTNPLGYAGYADYGLAAPYAAGYGGAGVGNVAIAGELPVGGATALAGQVPIIGGVQFGGAVPAAGGVTISGSCACGCSGPYMY